LFIVYYPKDGWIYGDTTHYYIFESDEEGWIWVIANGADDGDYGYHDAEVYLFVGWTGPV